MSIQAGRGRGGPLRAGEETGGAGGNVRRRQLSPEWSGASQPRGPPEPAPSTARNGEGSPPPTQAGVPPPGPRTAPLRRPPKEEAVHLPPNNFPNVLHRIKAARKSPPVRREAGRGGATPREAELLAARSLAPLLKPAPGPRSYWSVRRGDARKGRGGGRGRVFPARTRPRACGRD